MQSRKLLLLNALFIVMLCVTNTVFAQRQNVIRPTTPFTKFETWNVSVIGAQTTDYDLLSPVQKRFVYTLPPLITSVIKEVNTHFLSFIEKTNAREIKRQDALITLSKSLEQLLLTEDTNALANEKLDVWQQRQNSKKNIKDLKRRIKQVEKLSNEDIPLEDNLSVVLNEQIEYLNISLVEDLQAIAIKLNSHMLVYYKIYELEQYLVLEIFEYNAVQRQSTKILVTVVEPNNITQIYDSIKIGIQESILGTNSASLKISVKDNNEKILYDANILLDGTLVGFGKIEFYSLPAGTHAVHIIYGGEQRNEVIVLNTKETLNKVYFFDIVIDDTITIVSNPSGAKVYVDLNWMGNTPVIIAKPQFISLLEIKTPGYEDYKETISSETSSIIDKILTPLNPIPLQERLDTSKKKFYNAFTIFAFSLVVPILLNGFYINEVNANTIGKSNLSVAGIAESNLRQTAYFYSFLAGTVVSTGLGIFTFVRLRQYLKVASEYHER